MASVSAKKSDCIALPPYLEMSRLHIGRDVLLQTNLRCQRTLTRHLEGRSMRLIYDTTHL